MHNWWIDIKKGYSRAANAVGDVFDRRALQEQPTPRTAGEEGGIATMTGADLGQDSERQKVGRLQDEKNGQQR